MDSDLIIPGETYVGPDRERERTVTNIVRGRVFYRIRGVLSLQPIEADLDDFAKWAERRMERMTVDKLRSVKSSPPISN